jgi:hypothetical protein
MNNSGYLASSHTPESVEIQQHNKSKITNSRFRNKPIKKASSENPDGIINLVNNNVNSLRIYFSPIIGSL